MTLLLAIQGAKISVWVREDTHKKSVYFSGWTTKSVERKRKNCQNPFQAIIRLKRKEKKWHGPLSH